MRAFILGLLIALSCDAQAHDFWIDHGNYKSPSDGAHCCGLLDCFTIPDDDMVATKMGWMIKSTSELIPYPEAQISEDGKFWRCRRYDGTRRCFFAPQPNS